MDAVLSGKGVSVAYHQNIVIPAMDVQIPRGRITSVIGPNGCGKSTLLKALSRMTPIREGHVLLDGRQIAKMSTVEVAKKMAILPQGPQAPGGLTVKELVAYGRYPHQKGFGRLKKEDQEAVKWALSITDMEELADRDIDALSGGQRQRVWLAMALAQNTKILFLDEPTTYLDIRYQIEILELVRKLNREYGITIIMVLHDINQAIAFSDRIIGLKDGCVEVQGPPEQVITADSMESLYGIHLEVAEVQGQKFVLTV